ncbi:MAG: phosphoglucosamine mutase, partial [Alphaproteobacteria bacterium]|nr:phosphoglucosamine mutase [Alphaproteobacteria bacterium]
MKKIFGTDGVRGVAISELTVELAMKIGKAAACLFAPNGGKILIGKDTRISSSSLEAAIAAGITSCGADAVLLGVLPTPAVAFLTKISSSNAGIVISA